MYKDFYHMKIDPFSTLPSPDIFFASETHQAAWNYLVEGLGSHEPSLLVTGAHGTGKSLLSLMLVRELMLQNAVQFAYTPVPDCSYRMILRDVARLLHIPLTTENESEVQYAIFKQYCESSLRTRVCLIFDDIQGMDSSVLARIVSFTNFNHNAIFPFRLVLFGQPSSVEMLSSLRRDTMHHYQYRQCRVTSLKQDEIKNYIYYRLLMADAPGIPAFAEEALQEIYTLSRGTPLVINSLCVSCLRLGAAKELATIDRAVVVEAAGLTCEAISIPPIKAEPEKIQHSVPASADKDSSQTTSSSSEKERNTHNVTVVRSTSFPAMLLIFVFIVGVFCAALLVWREMANIFIDAENKSSKTKNVIPYAPAPGSMHEGSLNDENNPPSAVVQKKHEVSRTETPAEAIQPGAAVAPPVREAFPAVPSAAAVTATFNTRAVIPVSATSVQPAPAQHPYALQLACYTSEVGAREKYRFFESAGLKPYMVKNISRETGEMLWVIYTGWYMSLEEAEQTKIDLHLEGSIAARVPYAVLISTYPSVEEMSAMRLNLDQHGYFPYALPGSQGTLYLYAGAFSTRAGAEQLYRQLQADGIKSQVVLR
jgi:general secretion pathway protein A